MDRPQVLYISGSIGLGHVSRDLAIAGALRRHHPEVEIAWLAAEPASARLKEAGEKLLPEAEQYAVESHLAEGIAKGYKLNLIKYTAKALKPWKANMEVFKRAISARQFDLIVHDEAYEVSIALRENPQLIKAPVVGILDFIGDFRMSWSPLEWVLVRYLNGLWAKEPGESLTLIIGELADLPDAKLGFGRPSLRDVAQRKGTHNVGYVLDFDPRDYADRAQLRIKLGYGEDPLVICCIGGTAVGKELLELCGRACPSAREKLPKLRMKLVCGPRLSPNSLDVPPGVEVVGYVPALHEHLAAADLVVTAAGGMTTLELTALRRPFLYFPIQQHFEQQVHVAHRLQRHGAGVKMDFSKTSPELLAEHIVTNIAKPVTWPPIRVDGMERAAELISSQLRTTAVP